MLNLRLKEIREQKKISQYELAELLKIPHSNIATWELGKNTKAFEKLATIAKALNVSADYLLGLPTQKQTATADKKPFDIAKNALAELNEKELESIQLYIEGLQTRFVKFHINDNNF